MCGNLTYITRRLNVEVLPSDSENDDLNVGAWMELNGFGGDLIFRPCSDFVC